ncbi:MAG: hypothetical protein ACXW1W_00575 [Methylococcaceae bacterium]
MIKDFIFGEKSSMLIDPAERET